MVKTWLSKLGGLWQHSDFMKLWAGETVSLFGSQVTAVALPLVAAITLQATPEQMGYLNAAQYAPYLVISLIGGVYIDRYRRLPIMVAANFGRAAFLAILPLCFFLDVLSMPYLLFAAFTVGSLSVIFDLSYQSYLPTLIEKDDIVEGNSKLELSRSLAEISGPGFGGILVDILTAPVVIIVDIATYIVSGFALLTIEEPEEVPGGSTPPRSVVEDVKKGLKIVFYNPYLRAISGEAATYNFFNQITWAVLILYLTRTLAVEPGILGLLLATASVGSLVGTVLATPCEERFGVGPTIVGAMVVGCTAPLLVPLAGGPAYLQIAIVAVSFFFGGIGVVVSNIHVLSLRQSITHPEEMGKMHASYRFVVSGVLPLGALLGGFLGGLIGLRLTLFVGAVGTMMATGWVLWSPVPGLDTMPEHEEAA